MNKECEITRDLIPLYIDHIASDASRDYVEEHVAHCPECQKILNDMQSHITLPIDYSERLEEAKPITKLKKTINRKIIITATICVLIVLTFVSSIYISTKITYDIPSSDVTFYEANGKLLMKYKGHGVLLYSAYASNIDNSPTKEWHISFTQTFFERYVQPLYKKDKPQVLDSTKEVKAVYDQDGHILWQNKSLPNNE